MKKRSILKTLQIIILIALLFQIIYLFTGKGENNIYQIISNCLMFVGLIFAFVFSGKLEKEKIERENRK